MPEQKAENLLNLALDATEEERIKSLELDVGYDPIEREWDLIVKYSGSLDAVRLIASSVTEMANEYAVITIKESLIPRLAQFSEIEFIEKPKRIFFQVTDGKRVSCINQVQQPPFSLHGSGVLVGIVDSGIDYTLSDFRNADGTTRIRALWDQTVGGNPPEGYAIGTEYTREEINEALTADDAQGRNSIVSSRDFSGHGTAVAGIVAGSGQRNGSRVLAGGGEGSGTGGVDVQAGQTGTISQGSFVGVAPESELIIVKMGNAKAGGFPRTTELMQGVDYIVRKALELQMPVAINVSFGNTYGSHEPYN